MSEWPRYQSHKIVQAAKIVAVTVHLGRVTAMDVRPVEGGPTEQFMPTQEGMADRVGVGDWAMLYPDGFKSVSPAKAFEEGYTIYRE